MGREASLDVFEAIYNRQSIGKVKPDEVPRAVIEKLLSAAVQAPNHHKVRPWRFFVISGESRMKLGDVLVQSLLQRVPEATPGALQKESERLLRAPVVIAVAVDKPIDSRVDEIENVCAAAAAVQNLLLAATALGLATKWRTGQMAVDPMVKAALGLSSDQHLIAFVYIGYPELEPPEISRPSYADRTVWMDW
jgi:nitroreductase